MRVSKNIREIIHFTGRICRRFDGCVTDSFTVTLRNNSWTVIINNNLKKRRIYGMRLNITIGLHYLMPVLEFKLYYEQLGQNFQY